MLFFSDKSKYNIFGYDGKKIVWGRPNIKLEKQNIQPTVKHGGGHIIVWGCMSYSGVGNLAFIEGIMNDQMYIDVLPDNLQQSAIKSCIQEKIQFQQDNDPKYTRMTFSKRIQTAFYIKKSLAYIELTKFEKEKK
jgi:hypothetical protein